MKKIQSACILQTLVFQQREDRGFSTEQKLEMSRDELAKYKAALGKDRIRFQMIEETERDDGSILIRIRKQYNDKTDVSEYFD